MIQDMITVTDANRKNRLENRYLRYMVICNSLFFHVVCALQYFPARGGVMNGVSNNQILAGDLSFQEGSYQNQMGG